MSPTTTRHIRHARSGQRGFALLITITLVAFLVLVVVSLATFTRVETQVAGNSQQIEQAHQNALMALNIALGQLQRHTGPDQRVTARADVIKPSTLSWSTNATPASALFADTAELDSYWVGTQRNRNWTGAWLDSAYDPSAYDPNNPSAFNPSPSLQSWLVSGNENTTPGDTFKPTDVVNGLSASSTALDKLNDANGKPHRLLVKASADVTDAASLDRAVTAPEIEITSTSVPGTSSAATPVGHYAWWVGDEGVKARANLVDPYAAEGTTEANRTRIQSAQRTAIEAMTTSGTDGLATSYPANADSLLKILAPAQLASLSTDATLPTELKTRFHDLGVSSRGVLADTKNGGLKSDLSYILGQSTQSNFLTALRATYGGNTIAPLATTSNSLSANPLLNTTSTPLAALPSGFASDFFKNTATWEQLWSFANQGATFNSNGQASPRRHTAVQHGLYPLVIQVKMFYRLRFGDGTGSASVNHTDTLWVDSIPVVLLANPYAVPLAPADYQLRVSILRRTINSNVPELIFSSDATAAPSAWTSAFPSPDEPSYTGDTTFILRTTGMAAGEAQIFTIDPSPSANSTIDAEDRIPVTGSSSTQQVVMKNDFDPVPALTFNTGKTLPAADTHAALRLADGAIITHLYMDYIASPAQKDRRVIQYITAQQDLTEYNGTTTLFVVDPMSEGIRQGGGAMLVINQPPTTTHPDTLFTYQQAPFLQVNYRALLVSFMGGGSSHPLQWARRFDKNGSTGSAGTSPNSWIEANLMRPSGSTTTSRWGIANIGEGGSQTQPPASLGGSNVGFNNFLYDIPRPGRPLSSLGQLQHFNTAGYVPDTAFQISSVMNSWQTNYPVSNSYPQPRIARDQLLLSNATYRDHFDGSFLWNDLFWDRFYFSTYPQTGSFDFATDKLINSRYRPFRDQSVAAWNDTSSFRGDGNAATAANARIAAKNLLVEGAFNINSTSVEAWKAVFSSLKKIPVGTESAPSAPFPRVLTPTDGSSTAATGTSPDSWTGFRDLSRAEVQSLAEEMVMQIRKRGPFLSLSDFLNRRLVSTGSDTLGLGLSGALQAALDRVVNLSDNISAAFRAQSASSANAMADSAYILPSALAGFPGYLLQGDVLSALGPTLSARSDTFTIRTYGDSVNPATGEVTGRAWCEAVVQRTPDYVVPKNGSAGDAATDTATDATNITFGRRYQIVSFRWLSPDDI